MSEEVRPNLSKLQSAYCKAQSKFRVPVLNREAEIKKEGKFLYKTYYADLKECFDCVKSIYEFGLSFSQTTKKIGNDWFLVLELMHESGETKESMLPINVNQTNQQLGGTLTYLKRYQFSAFFGLAADFDDDGNATEDKEVKFSKPTYVAPPRAGPPPPPKPTPKVEDDNVFMPESYFMGDAQETEPEQREPLLTIEEILELKTKLKLSNDQMKDSITRALGYSKFFDKCTEDECIKILRYLRMKVVKN